MDLAALVERLRRDSVFQRVINNPLAQLGTPNRRYLGATILPERNVDENEYTEQGLKFRTIIANHADRYSPVQRKRGILTGWMRVTLGESDIGSDITGRDFDALIRILLSVGANDDIPMAAMTRVLDWVDRTLTRPLVERNEKDRWDAIVNAQVVLKGDDNYEETVDYLNPSGHRFNVAGDFDSDAYDPLDDYIAAAEILKGKGYTPIRIIQGSTVTAKLVANDKIRTRIGWPSLTQAGLLAQVPGRASKGQINALLADNELPPIEEYNLQYRTQAGSGYFLPRDCFVMIGATDEDQLIDTLTADTEPVVLQNTIGYTGVGRPAGQTRSGRVIKVKYIDDEKPPRIDGQGWQTSLPVILEPEGFVVGKNIV
jgi:hypothetical protein